ncbi:MAG: SurA N-terminal domain-containing protein [Verrucomicrobiota bacterium]|nr:SurA N-terminal domain-containing protein [Verrucomicrobiota bacterium]
MMRHAICFLLLCSALVAEVPQIEYSDNHKIGIQNSILAKVNGTTISMMDVKKKLDLAFHQFYPHLAQSNEARFQFYQTSWRSMLMEMIDHELILADASEKEVKLTDAEVREEIENRFGPNVMSTLDRIGIVYEEAWKLIKNEITVQRMTWWFINSKAISQVTPQEIRQAYRLYLKEHPPYTQWNYSVITIRAKESLPLAQELHEKIVAALDKATETIQEFEKEHPDVSISVSTDYTAKDTELSSSHRDPLSSLAVGTYSAPVEQLSRDKQKVCRMFHLKEKEEHPAPTFEELSPKLKNDLLQKVAGEISHSYLEKLRKHFRFDEAHLKEVLPEDFQPFVLE